MNGEIDTNLLNNEEKGTCQKLKENKKLLYFIIGLVILLIAGGIITAIILSNKKNEKNEKEIEPFDDLILVIDMQNVYNTGEKWACENMNRTINNIKLIEKNLKKEKQKIILTKFEASKNPVGKWKEYNEINKDVNENKTLNEMIPELKYMEEKYPVYYKSTYSALTIEELKQLSLKAKRVIITGVVTECCVMATAFQLIDLGAYVVFLKDACSAVNESVNNNVASIFDELSYCHTKIMTTQQFLNGE